MSLEKELKRMSENLQEIFQLLATDTATTGDGHSAREYSVAVLVLPRNNQDGLGVDRHGKYQILSAIPKTDSEEEDVVYVGRYATISEVVERFSQRDVKLGTVVLLENSKNKVGQFQEEIDRMIEKIESDIDFSAVR